MFALVNVDCNVYLWHKFGIFIISD